MQNKELAAQARLFAAQASLLAAAALALSFAGAPARAADDGQGTIIGSMMKLVGVDTAPETASPKIDYRQRPPLVLPRSMDLPPPARSAAARDSAWPKDPDVLAQRRAEELARAPAVRPDQESTMTVREMQADRAPASARMDNNHCESYDHECDPRTIWSQLKIKKGDPGAMPGESAMVVGKEPPREYLTQPPPGYMTATRVVKPTWETRRNTDADDRSNVYFMRQAGQKVTDDDASDN